MAVTVSSRSQVTLELFERVAWRGEPVEIPAATRRHADTTRAAFLRLLDRPDVTIYGVTSGYGDRAALRLTPEERRRHAATAAHRDASFGKPLPERVTRGIVLARLANLLDGHAAVSGRLLAAVAAMLDPARGPLPAVPVQGNGGSGEILALGHLFAPLLEPGDLGEKEGLALINGSPCAAALIADAALAARARLVLAYEVLALSVEAFRAPLDAYDPALDALWGDDHETRALRRLRALLGMDRVEGVAAGAGGDGRRPYQAPVSYRILARLLGQAERDLDGAEHAAAVSLRSVSDNPVYLPPRPDAPDPADPDGRVLSTGGYHNAAAPAALHRLAVCWAELCQLAERHVEHLTFTASPPATRQDGGQLLLHLLLMVATGYSEEARAAAQPVLLARAGPGQNDVTAPSFLAWSRQESAAACLEAVLAILAAAATHWLSQEDRSLPPPLARLVAETRQDFPPLTERRSIGPDIARLAEHFRARVFESGDDARKGRRAASPPVNPVNDRGGHA
jgi:histidine ammonia-lyase